MKTFESQKASWLESFGHIAERIWAAKHGTRKGSIASLHREIEGIGYEGFRKMIDGQIMPRKDIMEQVASVLEIDPREFPEYRLLQIHEACRRHPEIDQIFYEQISDKVCWPCITVICDICRPDLLFEIEATAVRKAL